MFTKAMYIERRGASLRALDVEISRLTDDANLSSGDIALEYYEAIQGLEIARDRAAATLQRLEAVSEEAVVWSDAVSEMENSWNDLRNSLVAAIAATGCEQVES
jgi:flagellar biosynthesis regulator FlaF